MILGYASLLKLGPTLLDPFDPLLVNPASIDIRVGREMQVHAPGRGRRIDLTNYTYDHPWQMQPGEFLLIATLERITVPIEYAVDLRLKSSRAREGYDHSLAFWFDPGWDGVGTMEIQNVGDFTVPIYPELKIAQIIVHVLDEPCEKPYVGKYQGAMTVEGSKDE